MPVAFRLLFVDLMILLSAAACESTRGTSADAGSGDDARCTAAPGCDGVERWLAYDRFAADCPSVTPAASRAASGCELYIDHLGDGFAQANGATYRFFKLYLAESPVAVVVQAGMLIGFRERDDGPTLTSWSLGTALTPNYHRLGFTYEVDGDPCRSPFRLRVLTISVFADLRQPDGTVNRVWLQPPEAGLSAAEAFASPSGRVYASFGWVDYVDEASSPVFALQRACAP